MSLSGVYICKSDFNICNESKPRYVREGEIFLLSKMVYYIGKYHFTLRFACGKEDSIFHKYQTDAIKKYCEKTKDYPELLL